MFIIKVLISVSIAVSICNSQGKMNAFGVGNYYHNQGAFSPIDASSELAPTFSKTVSLSNPSTWHNLKFTYLSLHYGGSENRITGTSKTIGYSGLSNAAWILPIKSEASLGVAIAPYTDQRVNLVNSDTSYFEAFDTSYSYLGKIDRSGGIMSLKVGASYRVNEKVDIGIFHDILFGSSRLNESLEFGGSSVRKLLRVKYSGMIGNLFLGYKLNKNLQLNFKYTQTLKPLEGLVIENSLFDDVNDNDYHDFTSPYYDFPYPDSVESIPQYKLTDMHVPKIYKVGINRSINDRLAFVIEISRFLDNVEKKSMIHVPFGDWIKETNYTKLSAIHYPNNRSLWVYDKLLIKTSILFSVHDLELSKNKIHDQGISIGFGFKFKPIGNQINVNYYVGKREYSNSGEEELTKQLQVGVSIADIWFVKRRQK